MYKAIQHIVWGLSLHAIVQAISQVPLGSDNNASDVHSFNVSSCPGYELGSLEENEMGLTARLSLMGEACNAFGRDIPDLVVEVTYETNTRLHVNIFDSANQQYTIPQSIIERPPPPVESFKGTSDLVFNHESSPFAFWITRRSEPEAPPIFDTRITSLPQTPISPVIADDESTAFNGFPLIFEDQYLQLASALPLNANIYGLGEVVASSGFRRNVESTIQTMWSRDIPVPIDENLYGSHPIYMEHRFDENANTSQSHGVFLLSAAGADILLFTPPSSEVSLIEYRMIGGVFDFYFFSGPTPNKVIEQYGALIGLPIWQPAWGFGFHLCRWGYKDIAETREQVINMRKANIPLEVMGNDIDLYHVRRDFTFNPVGFPGDEMRRFIGELTASNQHYVPIVDSAVPKPLNETDIYVPYTTGVEAGVFVTNPDGSEYIGMVWPGYTLFQDWFHKNTQQWWTDSFRNWSIAGLEFSGIWFDMNEASSFCDGSCGTEADLTKPILPFILPGEPGNIMSDYPECYDSGLFGPSGNITVDGSLTCVLEPREVPDPGESDFDTSRRTGQKVGFDVNEPPYAIHNFNGRLSVRALATNVSHAGGQMELDVHNIWGLMAGRATYLALQDIIPGQRPFLFSRSTFPSSGRWTGHWLGDNYSLWSYLRSSIAGVLQFQLFQIPFVGADTCGFIGNTNEELCNRWMSLSAFTPFYRNHNIQTAISQEPYRWDSVADASRIAIGIRYSLLPYWYTLFANSSTFGTPPVRALFFEFPDEPELFGVDEQFLVGGDILVTPVVRPNMSHITGFLPGRGNVIWRDWYTHEIAENTPGEPVTLAAPLSHINVHIRDGSIILLHAKPAYTIEETRQGPYSLLVSQSSQGLAFGTAYVDDGISNPPVPNRILKFLSTPNEVVISSEGDFTIEQKLTDITILGVDYEPTSILINGRTVGNWTYGAQQGKLVAHEIDADLNVPLSLEWMGGLDFQVEGVWSSTSTNSSDVE